MMNGWRIYNEDGELVDIVYYNEDCDAQYVKSAENLPSDYTVTVD